MPFKKGHKRVGGRKKGCGNIFKIKTLREACEEQGFCFASKLVELAKAGDPLMIKEGMRYLFPTAVQISGPDNGPIKTEIESSYDERLIDDLEKLLEDK